MGDRSKEAGEHVLSTIKQRAGIGAVLGIAVTIAGVLALIAPLIAGLSLTIAIGVLLIVSGIARLYFAFKLGSFKVGLLVFLLGLLSVATGGYLVARPSIGLSALTLFLAVYFLVDGILEIIWSFRVRGVKGWGWSLFSGIAAVVLGIMIWRQFPVSGKWAVGMLTGVHMIVTGAAMTLLSRAAHRATKGK